MNKPLSLLLLSCRVIEMPHAYQCCVFGASSSFRAAAQWEETMGSEEDELQKRTLALFPIHTDCEHTAFSVLHT